MITIIIGTHGKFSKELLRSAEMIFGAQKNIGTVTFEPGESVDDLVKKYNSELEKLDCKDGTLFMVDLFGGSLYNAASRIAVSDENMDVITGISMPMLLEILASRDSKNVKELIEISKKAGSEGIKSLKEALVNIEEDDL